MPEHGSERAGNGLPLMTTKSKPKRKKEQYVCPDCLQPYIQDKFGPYILGSRCGCPEKHWAVQDAWVLEQARKRG